MLRGLSDMMPNFGNRPHMTKSQVFGINSIDSATVINLVFRVPFASELPGPDTEDIIHATRDAVERWTHPQNAPDDVPVYKLPVHARNLEKLDMLCKELPNVEAQVHTSYPKGAGGPQVVAVSLTGPADAVFSARGDILQNMPIYLYFHSVDLDGALVYDSKTGALKTEVMTHLDTLSSVYGTDVFLLGPKFTPVVDGMSGGADIRVDQRWRVAIYGDLITAEYVKTSLLAKIDELLGRVIDSAPLEHSLHQMICGRSRRQIKLLEATTNTALYFSPPLSEYYTRNLPGTQRLNMDRVIITGERQENINDAKRMLHDIVCRTRTLTVDAIIDPYKLDYLALSSIDRIRKIAEANGTYVMIPAIGRRVNMIRLQTSDPVGARRSLSQIMRMTNSFYSANWLVNQPDPRHNLVGNDMVRELVRIHFTTNADMVYDGSRFHMLGTDESVRAALEEMSVLRMVQGVPAQIRVNIELENEHKEFVSGKKNGKVNKIMGQSSAQVSFHHFSESHFVIDILSNNYESLKKGLELVESELPAEISFYVPDQYHKRIIGIGGQHIQRLMKRYFVYVKFSNAAEMGYSREDGVVKVDNVVCRTPSRNANTLELVKNDILQMVDANPLKDSEPVTQIVSIDRLWHRKLIVRQAELERIQNTHNCTIEFPNTEQASDDVTITGPHGNLARCVDELLSMVPDRHELVLIRSDELVKFLESPNFTQHIVPFLREQYEVDVVAVQDADGDAPTPVNGEVSATTTPPPDDEEQLKMPTVTLRCTFTRNNAGSLHDALETFTSEALAAGIHLQSVRGSSTRPKSDSFSESFQFFESKLLHTTATPADAPGGASSSSASSSQPFTNQGSARENRTFLERLRRPGVTSSISSFLDRRKNSAQSATHFFQRPNVSRSSLVSMESTRSFNADRMPWNDSGVNLTDDDAHSSSSIWGASTSSMVAAAAALRRPGSSLHESSSAHGHLSSLSGGGSYVPGDMTPRFHHHPHAHHAHSSHHHHHHHAQESIDSGRPSTSHSTASGYPGPRGHLH